MKRKFNLLFIFLLFFQTVSSGMVVPAQTLERSEDSMIDQVTYVDEKGEEVNVEDINDDSSIFVSLDWSLKDVIDVEKVHTEELLLLDEVSVTEKQSGDTDFFTYEAKTDGTIAFNFTELKAEDIDYEAAEGTIELEVAVQTSEENKEEEKENIEENDKEKESKESKEEEKIEEENDKPGEKESDSSNMLNELNPLSITSGEGEEKHGFNIEITELIDSNDEKIDTDNRLEPKDEFMLKIDWSLDDATEGKERHNYKEGDTVTYVLPEGILILEEMQGELKDAQNQVVAKYTITTE